MSNFNFTKQVFQGKSIYRILFNKQVFEHCQNLKGRCLDIAGGDSPSYTKHWSFDEGAELISSDKKTETMVDFNERLNFEDNSFDHVFLFNAIYIVKKPKRLMGEINRILKPGGNLYIASPFILNEAREPDDFRRLTSQGLEKILKKGGFDEFEIIPYGNRFSAAAFLLNSFWLFNVIRWPIYGLALGLDKLVPEKINKLHPCPLGYFVIAKK